MEFVKARGNTNPDARDLLADEFLRSTGADIREGHGGAYYAPGHDFISMPAFEAFKGADHFYNTTFHELTHWTGHKLRLDRDLKNRFGSRAYAGEELVAELGAAFLSAEFGFDGDVQHASYIATWIDLLTADTRVSQYPGPCVQRAPILILTDKQTIVCLSVIIWDYSRPEFLVMLSEKELETER